MENFALLALVWFACLPEHLSEYLSLEGQQRCIRVSCGCFGLFSRLFLPSLGDSIH